MSARLTFLGSVVLSRGAAMSCSIRCAGSSILLTLQLAQVVQDVAAAYYCQDPGDADRHPFQQTPPPPFQPSKRELNGHASVT